MLNPKVYKKIIDKFYPEYKSYFKVVESEIIKAVDSCDRFLDAGCGNGYHTIKFGKNAKFLVGIDSDEQRIKEAKKKYKKKNIRFFCRDLKSTGFKDNYFDVILCQFVVEHLKDVEKALMELSRVLKKGGKLIIITSNTLNPQNLLNKILPSIIRSYLKKKFGIETNPYPIFYRCNYVSKLDRLLEKRKMKRIWIYRVDCPMIFQSNEVLLLFWVFFDKIVGNSLQFLKSTIYVIYKKF
jgi:ubiquinone/menaquinone biosynthesis C-methylase UbiE